MRDPSHNKNLPIMSVIGSINQNVFKEKKKCVTVELAQQGSMLAKR